MVSAVQVLMAIIKKHHECIGGHHNYIIGSTNIISTGSCDHYSIHSKPSVSTHILNIYSIGIRALKAMVDLTFSVLVVSKV